jgi:hypothetical protein
MGMSPEARRRRDEGFSRRVAEQQARHAATWQRAAHLGQALDLGEPLGIYRTEITPPLGVRRVLRLLIPVPGLLLALVLLLARAPGVALPQLVFFPFLAGGYALMFFVISRQSRFTRWLYGYTGGLAEVDPDGRPRVIRWSEVVDVADEWTSSSSDSDTLWDYRGFRLTVADGRSVPITAKYRNALDPYGPVGGILRALTPAEVGDAIPRFPSIADLITDRVVARVVDRRAAALRDGAVITIGEVRVTRDGMAGPKDAALTPWGAIERVELRPGRMRVFPIGGKRRKYDNHRDGSGYAVHCRVLLALGVTATYEASG